MTIRAECPVCTGSGYVNEVSERARVNAPAVRPRFWFYAQSGTRVLACVLAVPLGLTPFLVGFAIAEVLGIVEKARGV